jgi:hypothetical protein
VRFVSSNREPLTSGPGNAIDYPVKAARTTAEKKTAGTIAVEKHRPAMNKLTDAARCRLHQRATHLLFGLDPA